MQKFYLLLSATIFVALGFTSCEPKPVVPVEPPYDGEYAEYCIAHYSGKQQSKYVYYINLSEKDVMAQNGLIIGEGNIFALQIMCAEEHKEGNYYLPLEDTYSIEEKNAKISIDHYFYKEEWDDYDVQTTKISVGEITIKKIENGYRIDVKYFRDGEEHNIRYEGVLKTNNYTEPTDASLTEFSINDLQYLHNYGEYSAGIDYVYFQAKNNDTNPIHCFLQFFAPTGATSLPTGTYTIKNVTSYQVNVVPNWNPILYQINDEGYYSWVYYAKSGTVTVTSKGFAVNMISNSNRAITITYTGNLAY